MHTTHRTTTRPGFTLIEILIVVVILGILAAIVIPQFAQASEDASKSAFAAEGKALLRSAMRYQLDTGQYPEDASSGVIPAGMESYVSAAQWEGGTPLGGVWDSELGSFGVVSAIGVHFDGTGSSRDDAFMLEIDSAIDDGDLDTGRFQKLAADRYYFVLAD